MSNDTKKPEDMSLAELLGGGSPVEPGESKPAPAQPDEAGSGMINLAQMVMTANKPKPAPAPAPQADPFGGQNAWGGASQAGSPSQYPAAPAPLARKKSPMGIIIGIAAAVIVVAGAAGFFLLADKKDDASRDAELAVLQAQLALALQKAKETGNEDEIARLQAKVDATAAGQKVEPENMEFSEDEAGEDEEDGEDGEDEEGKPRKTGRRGTKTAARTTTTETKTPSAGTETTAAKTEPAKTATPATGTKGNTSELSSLLGGGSKAPAPSSGLPAKPSKEQVAKAMAPVASKSQSTCGQWGSGRISVRVVVGGNGRVRDAIPQGEHAASPLGRCVSKVAMTASFPPFTDPTLTFTYPITVN